MAVTGPLLGHAHHVPLGNSRKNEAISVEPLGVLGVELHKSVEENVGDGCHAPGGLSAHVFPLDDILLLHGRARVAGVGMCCGIGLRTSCQQQALMGFPSSSLIAAQETQR